MKQAEIMPTWFGYVKPNGNYMDMRVQELAGVASAVTPP
jgi:hypothetical protein